MSKIYTSIDQLMGNTPLLKLGCGDLAVGAGQGKNLVAGGLHGAGLMDMDMAAFRAENPLMGPQSGGDHRQILCQWLQKSPGDLSRCLWFVYIRPVCTADRNGAAVVVYRAFADGRYGRGKCIVGIGTGVGMHFCVDNAAAAASQRIWQP